MCKANRYITGSSSSFHFAERSSHCLRYITQGMIEKLYRVLVDAGDITSLQRAWETLQHVECTGQKVPKQLQEAWTGLQICQCNNDGASGYGNLFTVLLIY